MQGGVVDLMRVERQRNKANLGWFTGVTVLSIAISRGPKWDRVNEELICGDTNGWL
jgi:hypothetical protein